MWPGWVPANCPVCEEKLGYRKNGEIATHLCEECQYWFTWDIKGKLLKPQTNKKHDSKGCGCASCKYREEQKGKK